MLQKVFCRHPCPYIIVGADIRKVCLAEVTVYKHDRSLLAYLLKPGRRRRHRNRDDAVHFAPKEHLQRLLLLCLRLAGIGQKSVIATVSKQLDDNSGQGCEERVVDAGHQKTDGPGLLCAQRLRHQVRLIIEPAGSLRNQVNRLLADAEFLCLAGEDTRHRRHRISRLGRYCEYVAFAGHNAFCL